MDDDDKLGRDRAGEIFQDDLTENETKARGEKRDDEESTLRLDPDIDSQEADRAMAENIFGVDEKKKSDA
jgi:hypothetical protein